jgi:Bifunctional DNA primase/polymerase, N-terminal/AAA domain
MTADLALSYISRGWPVFPCRAGETIDSKTGEVFAAKTPITPNGLKGASKREEIIREWWRRNPDAMVGIPTGAPIGAWVLDIDVKGNGYETLAALEAEHSPLPRTAAVSTASGGMHLYWKHVDGVRNRGRLGSGIDVRGDGGYVVAAGSRRDDGSVYIWDERDDRDWTAVPIAEAPQWLLDLVVRKESSPSSAAIAPRAVTNDKYVEAAIQREIDDLAATPMGGRNNALNDAAFAIGQFVGAGAVAEGDARAWLEQVAHGWGRDWHRCVKTIDNGLRAGIQQPRDIPEPSFHADDAVLQHVDISRLLAKARGEALASASAATERSDDTTPADAVNAAIEVVSPKKMPQAVRATAWHPMDPTKLPRRDFVYDQHLVRKYVSVTVSPGGLGKTSLTIAEAMAMVSGRPLLGAPVAAPLRVWLFNAEDPRDEMDRRLMAAYLHYKLKPEDIGDRLYLDTGREQDLVLAIEDKKSGFKIIVPVVDSIIAEIRAHRIDVMVIDPFVSTHGVNENDNGAIDRVAKLWGRIADETNCAIEIIHHVKKTEGRANTVDDSRGAGALLAAARSGRVLNRMSEDQASEAGVPVAERFHYFSDSRDKANMAPMNGQGRWRHLVSVPLGNTEGLMKPQDHVGVVTEWQWPGKDAMLDAVAPEALELIKVRLNSGSYRFANQSRQAEPWGGEVVASVLSMDVDADKKRINRLIEAWLKDGILIKETMSVPGTKGKSAPYLKGADFVNFAAA